MPMSLPPVTIRVKRGWRWLMSSIVLAAIALIFWSSWNWNMAWRSQPASITNWLAFLTPGLLFTIWSGFWLSLGWSYRIVLSDTEIRMEKSIQESTIVVLVAIACIVWAIPDIHVFWPVYIAKGLLAVLLPALLVIHMAFAKNSRQFYRLKQVARVRRGAGWSRLLIDSYGTWMKETIEQSDPEPESPPVPSSYSYTLQKIAQNLRQGKPPSKADLPPQLSTMAIPAGFFEGGRDRLVELLRQRLPSERFEPGISEPETLKDRPIASLCAALWALIGIGLALYLAFVFVIFPTLHSQTAWHIHQFWNYSIFEPNSRLDFDRAGQVLSATWDFKGRYEVCQASRTQLRCWAGTSPRTLSSILGVYLDEENRPWLLDDYPGYSTSPLIRWAENGSEMVDYPLKSARPLAITDNRLWAATIDTTTRQEVLASWSIATGQVERYPMPDGYSPQRIQEHPEPWVYAYRETDNGTEGEIYVWKGDGWQASGYAQARPATASPEISAFTVTPDEQLYVLAANAGANPYIVGHLTQGQWTWTEIGTRAPDDLWVDRHGRIWLTNGWDSIDVYQPVSGQPARLLASYNATNSNYPEWGRAALGPDGLIWATGETSDLSGEKLVWLDSNAANLPRPLPTWVTAAPNGRGQFIWVVVLLAWLFIPQRIYRWLDKRTSS